MTDPKLDIVGGKMTKEERRRLLSWMTNAKGPERVKDRLKVAFAITADHAWKKKSYRGAINEAIRILLECRDIK